MLIQHILTEEIFAAVFPGTPFHQHNNVARELYALEATFFTGDTKNQTLKGLEPYYAAIRAAAAQIGTHHEKQTFLKVIYENFYKVYNPKAADRLGVVYTPNEIVRFMIESADWLCEKHFGRNLIDKDVEILDPAAGTGTFICELLEHFRGQPAKLKHKYLEELHANEVAILPYYVANLNIEATYAAITGEYVEYPNLCFVDTLDNAYALRKYRGHMDDLFGSRERRERRAHQASEQPQDQRHHRQPAVQREPAERKREQQEPRIPGDRQAHQGDLHRREHRAEDQALRHVRALLPLGERPAGRERQCSRSSPTAASSKAAPSTAFARWWREEFNEIWRRRSRRRCARQSKAVGHQAQRVRHPDRRCDQLHGQASEAERLPHLLLHGGRSWRRRRKS